MNHSYYLVLNTCSLRDCISQHQKSNREWLKTTHRNTLQVMLPMFLCETFVCNYPNFQSGVVIHTCNLCALEADIGGSCLFKASPGLHSKFQTCRATEQDFVPKPQQQIQTLICCTYSFFFLIKSQLGLLHLFLRHFMSIV